MTLPKDVSIVFKVTLEDVLVEEAPVEELDVVDGLAVIVVTDGEAAGSELFEHPVRKRRAVNPIAAEDNGLLFMTFPLLCYKRCD